MLAAASPSSAIHGRPTPSAHLSSSLCRVAHPPTSAAATLTTSRHIPRHESRTHHLEELNFQQLRFNLVSLELTTTSDSFFQQVLINVIPASLFLVHAPCGALLMRCAQLPLLLQLFNRGALLTFPESSRNPLPQFRYSGRLHYNLL